MAWIGILGALAVLVSALLGAWIGGKIQRKGAIEAMGMQIQKEEEKRVKEKQEQDNYISQVVTNFLLSEIEWNYNLLDISSSKNLPIEFKGQLLSFEFQQAKYLLLKNPNDLVREIIRLYDLFKDIQAARSNRSDPGRINILNQILKQKEIIERLTT